MKKRELTVYFLLLLLSVVAGRVASLYLPEAVRVAENSDFVIGRFAGAYWLSGFFVIMLAFFYFFPLLVLKKPQGEKFHFMTGRFSRLFSALAVLVYVQLLVRNLQLEIPKVPPVAGWVGAVFFILGFVMRNVPPTAPLAVKTPWIKKESSIWYPVQSLTGFLMMATGIFSPFAGVFFPTNYIYVVAGMVALSGSISWLYSWYLYTKTDTDKAG